MHMTSKEGEQPSDRADAAAANFSTRRMVVPMIWDIALNTAIPLASYHLSKAYISPSEVTALIAASIFPILKSLFGVLRRSRLDPVAVLVLLGIGVSIVVIFLGGSPKVLLLRESIFGGVFGLACFVSLVLPRPIMFYFGRFFAAGNDPERRARFDASWQYPQVRRGHRIITLIWGLSLGGEFCVRVVMIYMLPIPTVLAVSPFLFGGATIFVVIWTIRYARKLRQRAVAAARRAAP
jgi:uncharacterized membrane protein